MRTLRDFFFFFVSMLCIGACSSFGDINDNTSEEKVFHVFNGDPDSEVTILWDKNDTLDLFVGDKRYSLASTNVSQGNESDFKGLFENNTWETGNTVWAVFPHSDSNEYDGASLALELTANQTALSGQTDKSLRISIARSTDSNLTFFNVCSGIKFSLAEENVVSVSFKGNNAEPLAGKVKVGFDPDGKPVVKNVLSPKAEIILSAPHGETLQKDEWYYITCLPVDLTQGYTMTITKADGQTIERKTGEPCQYKRSTVASVAGVDLEFFIADVSSVTNDFDCIIWKDDSHFAIIKNYENGLMREQVFICDNDTLGINYSRLGFPQIIYTKDECFYFGGFDNENVRVAHLDNNGTEEFFDLDLGSYWQEHAALIRQFKADTRGSNSNKKVLTNFQQLLTQLLLPCLFPPSGALISFGISSCAYMLSDNPTYLTVAEITSVAGSIFFAFYLGTTPVGWATIGYYAVWYGTQWGAIWLGSRIHENELLYNRLYGDVSLVPPSGRFDWLGGKFDLYLNFGMSSFDLNDLIWEVVEKPSFVSINSISDQVPHSLSCSVGINDSETIRKGQLIIRLINVYDQEDDLTFDIEQDTPMTVSPSSLVFNELTTKKVKVHSTDSWKIVEPLEWSEITRLGFDNYTDCELQITPKDKEYHLGMIVLEATTRATETSEPWTYTREILVENNIPFAEYEDLRNKLIMFYNDTGGPTTWRNRNNWCSDKPLYEWYGITFDEQGFMYIDLHGNNLIHGGSLDEIDILKSINLGDGWGGNSLEYLSVSGCGALEQLTCRNNLLTKLDVSECGSLMQLDCCNNQLVALKTTGCNSLVRLYCTYNLLPYLNVSGLSSLVELICTDNQLSSIEVDGCSSLVHLYCANNMLSALNISDLTSLTGIDCENNSLSDLQVTGCTSLTGIRCYDNPLKTINVSGCSALTTIHIGDDWWYYANNNSDSIGDCGFKLESVNVSDCSALESLCIYNSPLLSTLDVSGCTSLKSLSVSEACLPTLDVSRCPSLETLSISSTQLSSLSVSGLTRLTTLTCANNSLTSLTASDCSSLRTLNCSQNQLNSLIVSGCTSLIDLSCADNQLTSIDVSSCSSLLSLNCVTNHIIKQITNEDKLQTFSYDQRYYYHTSWDSAKQKYVTTYTTNQYGWYYPGEPEKGYHGR